MKCTKSNRFCFVTSYGLRYQFSKRNKYSPRPKELNYNHLQIYVGMSEKMQHQITKEIQII